jgi:hypothetical protein
VVTVVTEDWKRWQQGDCGGYAAALIVTYPHLRLGGIDWRNDEGFDCPSHYVAHDDHFAYDSAGVWPLPYGGVDGDGRWLPDMGSLREHGLTNEYGECGAFTEEEHDAAISHATRHGLLPRPSHLKAMPVEAP